MKAHSVKQVGGGVGGPVCLLDVVVDAERSSRVNARMHYEQGERRKWMQKAGIEGQ